MFDFDVLRISATDGEAEPRPVVSTLPLVALDTPVGEVPRGPAVTLAPEATVAAAIQTMRRRGRGAAVIIRQHRPVGVVTDRDIVSGALAGPEDVRDLPLSAVMVPCSSPLRETDSVGDVLRRMCATGRWHLPLVCGRGLVLGGIDFTDLAHWLRDQMIAVSVDAALRS